MPVVTRALDALRGAHGMPAVGGEGASTFTGVFMQRNDSVETAPGPQGRKVLPWKCSLGGTREDAQSLPPEGRGQEFRKPPK